MDCEQYDRVLLDLLYRELDEPTRAAAERHTQVCARCRKIEQGLLATRELARLPLAEIPEGFEQRVLEAEHRASLALPLPQRVGQWVSIAANYAMRPQIGMAALVMLMVGFGLLVLRARPPEQQLVIVPVGAEHAGGRSTEPVSQGNELSRRARDELALSLAELAAQGCPAALDKLLAVSRLPGDTVESAAALWETAQCQHKLGDLEAAQTSLGTLLKTESFRDRARAMLDELQTEDPSPAVENPPARAAQERVKRKAPAPATPPEPTASAPGAAGSPAMAASPPEYLPSVVPSAIPSTGEAPTESPAPPPADPGGAAEEVGLGGKGGSGGVAGTSASPPAPSAPEAPVDAAGAGGAG